MRQSALTIIEILIVVSLIGIISFPLYLSYSRNQANQGLRSSSEQLVTILETAHISSREVKEQKNWGVKSLSEKSFALVKGNRLTPQIEKTITLETFVSFPNSFEVWFDAGTGDTSEEKAIVIQNTIGNTKIIDVFKTGIIEIRYP